MAKRTQKDEGPKCYTATIEPVTTAPGHPSSRTTEEWALNKEEVEAKLARKGWKWKRITITEGRCIATLPWNKDEEAERYHAELENMLGHGFPPRYNAGPFPIGYRASPEVKDTDARKSWAKYLEEWSHGLSVSALPQYLDVDMGGTIYLPARLVQDAGRWKHCTAFVEATVAQWKASRAHMAEHRKGDRSPEARELRKDDMEAVKSLDALKGWTFPALVERIGAKPSPFDIPNPRLFHIPTGYMVPTINPGKERLMVEFWRHLLSAWDGPANTRAEVVRSMLGHHHVHGGRPEVYRELVRDTCARLRGLEAKEEKQRTNEQLGPRIRNASRWHGLAVTLEQWLEAAGNAPTSAKGADKVKSTRPDLKLLALVHALRYLTDDKGADITQANAQALAIDAGSKGKDAGRDLRRHYERYTMGKDQHAQRLDDGERHTVKRRYLDAIAMLEDNPKAKAMAEVELEELHIRE